MQQHHEHHSRSSCPPSKESSRAAVHGVTSAADKFAHVDSGLLTVGQLQASPSSVSPFGTPEVQQQHQAAGQQPPTSAAQDSPSSSAAEEAEEGDGQEQPRLVPLPSGKRYGLAHSLFWSAKTGWSKLRNVVKTIRRYDLGGKGEEGGEGGSGEGSRGERGASQTFAFRRHAQCRVLHADEHLCSPRAVSAALSHLLTTERSDMNSRVHARSRFPVPCSCKMHSHAQLHGQLSTQSSLYPAAVRCTQSCSFLPCCSGRGRLPRQTWRTSRWSRKR